MVFRFPRRIVALERALQLASAQFGPRHLNQKGAPAAGTNLTIDLGDQVVR